MRSRRIMPWVPLAWGLLLLTGFGLLETGCSQKPAPQIPQDIPTTLPSEEEARRVRDTNRETIPLLPQDHRGSWQSELPPVVDSTATPESSETGVVSESRTRYGYRVQLFATSNENLARGRAAEVQNLFEEKAYVEFEGLLYKVRVGDCLSRDEAAALRRKAIGLGHEGAFIVDTQVNVR